MPFQALLDGLVRGLPGARSALLMDATGELVLAAGARDDRHALLAAYQGIALAQVRRVSDRLGWGTLRYVLSRHQGGHVVLRPLRDGYYLVLTLGRAAEVGRCVHASALTQERMDQAL
ncbi:MAG TPA: roadblock/LC7 domain-containing protein [Vicinamibacteria bacterium]|nr:roadblock/LC7 domain-containing protein [Vicinamibacteria bacterium]